MHCKIRWWHPTPYSSLENPMDRGAWWAAVHGVTKSWTRLSDFTLLFTFMHWRRRWQPTPVFLPGESQGLGSLVGCRLWTRTESDTSTKWLSSSSSNNEWCWASFHVLLVICIFSLGHYLFKSFAHFLIDLSFCCWVVRVLYISKILDIWHINIFSHSVGCLFISLIYKSLNFW